MVSIVVINYKNEELTSQYINNQLSKIRGVFNIIVVNNGACRNTDEDLSSGIGAPIIKDGNYIPSKNNRYIISSDENLGFARGNNLAAEFDRKYLKSDYLLFSNNDIHVDSPDIIERLVEILELHPEVGMIGPKVVGLRGEFQSPEPYYCFWDKYVWMYWSKLFMNNARRIKRFKLDYSKNAKEGYHYKVMGSFFMVRSKDYFNCGMMDSNTFLYSEENILTERLLSIGKKVYYYPEVSVVHAHGVTTSKALGIQGISKYQMESDSYYYAKYKNVPKWKINLGFLLYKKWMCLKNKLQKI